MKVLNVNGLQYFISDNPVQDRLLRKALGKSNPTINYSGARFLIPHLSSLTFCSLLGCEKRPIDDWSIFEINLYAQLRKLPQHFKLLRGAAIRSSDCRMTGFVAVFKVPLTRPCGCRYCRKGMLGLIAHAEGSNHPQTGTPGI
jgi:hypothetical protein